MDDGRSVLIPSFLFFVLSLPDPLRFRDAGLFGIRLLCQFPGFPCQFSDFPSLFSDFCVRFRAFPVRIRFCGVLVRLFRCHPPAAGASYPFSGICFLPPVSAARSPFLPVCSAFGKKSAVDSSDAALIGGLSCDVGATC